MKAGGIITSQELVSDQQNKDRLLEILEQLELISVVLEKISQRLDQVVGEKC